METESISIFTQEPDDGDQGKGKTYSDPTDPNPNPTRRRQSSECRSTEAEVYNLKLTPMRRRWAMDEGENLCKRLKRCKYDKHQRFSLFIYFSLFFFGHEWPRLNKLRFGLVGLLFSAGWNFARLATHRQLNVHKRSQYSGKAFSKCIRLSFPEHELPINVVRH